MNTRKNIGGWLTAAAGGLALFGVGCPESVILSDRNENVNASVNDAEPSEQDIRESLENTPPEAKAGADLTVKPGAQVTLNATASTDSDRDRLSFF